MHKALLQQLVSNEIHQECPHWVYRGTQMQAHKEGDGLAVEEINKL